MVTERRQAAEVSTLLPTSFSLADAMLIGETDESDQSSLRHLMTRRLFARIYGEIDATRWFVSRCVERIGNMLATAGDDILQSLAQSYYIEFRNRASTLLKPIIETLSSQEKYILNTLLERCAKCTVRRTTKKKDVNKVKVSFSAFSVSNTKAHGYDSPMLMFLSPTQRNTRPKQSKRESRERSQKVIKQKKEKCKSDESAKCSGVSLTMNV